jgi:hypothetical protein
MPCKLENIKTRMQESKCRHGWGSKTELNGYAARVDGKHVFLILMNS